MGSRDETDAITPAKGSKEKTAITTPQPSANIASAAEGITIPAHVKIDVDFPLPRVYAAASSFGSATAAMRLAASTSASPALPFPMALTSPLSTKALLVTQL